MRTGFSKPCKSRVEFLAALALVLWLAVSGGAQSIILPPVWHWSNPLPHGADVFGVAYGNGAWVEAGELGQVFTSPDLVSWSSCQTHTTAALRAVAFFGGRLVITGQEGTVLFSDDLTDFYLVDLGTTNWLEGVAASSNLVVAVGDNGAVYSSTNAAVWQREEANIAQWLNGVAFGAGDTFVAVGEGGFIATSQNGAAWTTVRSGTSVNLNAVAWVENQFLATGDGGVVLTSANGQSWKSLNTGATNSLYAAAGSVSAGVTGGSLVTGDGELRLLGSTSWVNELASTLAAPAPTWNYYTAGWNTNGYVVSGASGFTITSSNLAGIAYWSPPTNTIRQWLWGLSRMSGYYVTVGNNGVIMSSPDGVNWTVELVPASVTNSVLLGVGGGTNLMLAVGSQGTVLWGTNVFYWNLAVSPTTNDLQGVLFDGFRYFASGGNGTILSSANGTNWTRLPTPTTSFVTSLALTPYGYAAVGDHGTILTSTNGTTWGLQQVTTNWLSQVRYLNGIGLAVGNNGTILTSTNGLNWAVQNSGVSAWLNAIEYVDGVWFVAGNQGTVLGSGDGTNWAAFATPTGKSLYGLASNQGQLVAAGQEGVILRSLLEPPSTPVAMDDFSFGSGEAVFLFSGQPDQPFYLQTSADLLNWTNSAQIESLDGTGTLLYAPSSGTNAAAIQFYRTSAPQ